MSRSKKIAITLIAVFVLIGTAASLAAQLYLAPFAKRLIEEKGSAALGAPLTVHDLSIGLFPPLTVNASNIEFAAPNFASSGTLKRLSIHASLGFSLDWKTALKDLKIKIVEPTIIYDLSAPHDAAKENSNSTNEATHSPEQEQPLQNLELLVEVDRGALIVKELNLIKYRLNDTSLRLNYQGSSMPIDLSMETRAAASQIFGDTVIPIKLSSKFSYQNQKLSTSQTTATVAGINANVRGSQDLANSIGTWTISASAKDFATNAEFAGSTLEGPIDAEFNTSVRLTRTSKHVEKLLVKANLTQAALRYKNFFQKPQGTVLKFEATGASDLKRFDLSNFSINFDRLMLSAFGSIALADSKSQNSQLQFRLQRTDLNGWDKFVPLMSEAPVSGSIEAAGSLVGDLKKPETLSIDLRPLTLDAVKASVKWQSEDKVTQLDGPVTLDGKVNLATRGTEISKADATVDADLSRMNIVVKDKFVKNSQIKFIAQLRATQSKNGIDFKNTKVTLGNNQLLITGNLRQPQRPSFNLQIAVPKLSITELSSMSPLLSSYKLGGSASGNLQINGSYDFKDGIEKSPFQVRGDLSANLPSFSCPRNESKNSNRNAKQQPNSAQAPATPAEPLLPNWPVAKSADITTRVQIASLDCKGVQARSVDWKGQLSRGWLTGALKIGRVFDGEIEVTALKMNLLESQPDIEGKVKTESIDVNQAMTWISVDWKDLVKGQLFGTHEFFMPDTSKPDYLAKTRASGKVELKNAFVSTLQLDQMINKAVAKLPGLGKKEVVNSKGVAANMKANYRFANSVMTLNQFSFVSPEKNEIDARGTVDINKNANLSGTAYLATAPVGGSVRAANSDSQGRLVLPFELKGNLTDPSVSFAEKTVEKLAENTAKKELQNLKQKAQDQGKKELEKKLEELKNKGLKNLFGK